MSRTLVNEPSGTSIEHHHNALHFELLSKYQHIYRINLLSLVYNVCMLFCIDKDKMMFSSNDRKIITDDNF